MARPNFSAGRRLVARRGGCHHQRPPLMPRLLAALIQNGAVMPNAAVSAPPSAGPIARAMLKPTLLAAIATCRSCFGTSCGVTACQAGAVSAPNAPIRNVNTSSTVGVTRPSATRTANMAAITVLAASPAMRKRRRSTMSARAPAGIATRKIGRLAATCTRETMSGSGLSRVISQLDAAVYIQVPTLAAIVAVQITAKAGCWNGPHGEPEAEAAGAPACGGLAASEAGGSPAGMTD